MERIKELEERVELLEEAVRIQNKVVEGSMEAANYWRERAMGKLSDAVKEAIFHEEGDV